MHSSDCLDAGYICQALANSFNLVMKALCVQTLVLLLICDLVSSQQAGTDNGEGNQSVIWPTAERKSINSSGEVVGPGNKVSHYCPLWSVVDKDGDCRCGVGLGGTVTCNNDTLLIHKCFCMTYDSSGKGPFVSKCFYSCNPPKKLAENTSDLILIHRNATSGHLNEIFCGYWNRKGLSCGECKAGFAPQAYSFDLRCIPCSQDELCVNIIKYVIAAFLGPTVFLLVILFFRIKITSGKFNTFILFSQVVSSPPLIRSVVYKLEFSDIPNFFYMYSKVIFSIYGIWNLDFFRLLIPGICFSTLNTRQTLGLDAATAIYPLVLLTILYILISLYERNCTVVIFLWRPFRVCFARCLQIWEIRNSVIDTFAAFVILSYSKILIFIFEVNFPIAVYDASGRTIDKHYRTYYDASIPMFDRRHIIYIPVSLAVLIVFILLPVILLCVYPTKCGRRTFRCGIGLHMFSEAFQGYYKDKTEGTRDYRFFPAVYLLTRIAVFSIYSAILGRYAFSLMAVCLMAVALLVLVLQPYKQKFNKYNRIDAAMIVLLAMQILSANSIAETLAPKSGSTTVALVIALLISLLPLLYIFTLMAQWIIQRRRSVSGTYEALININE